VRHQAGIVDDDIDAAMQPNGVVDQAFDLIDLCYVGLDDGVAAEAEFVGIAFSRSRRRAPRTSLAPSRARRLAAASPRPLLAPVITTTLSLIPSVMTGPFPSLGHRSAVDPCL
jgi:hypothetical protein